MKQQHPLHPYIQRQLQVQVHAHLQVQPQQQPRPPLQQKHLVSKKVQFLDNTPHNIKKFKIVKN